MVKFNHRKWLFMKKGELKKSEALLKTVIVYLIYFMYTYFVSYIIQLFGVDIQQWIRMGTDIIFLIFIVALYYKNLDEDKEIIKREYNFKKIIKWILIGIVASNVLNILLSGMVMLFFPNSTVDQNTLAIQDMATISVIYTIFKTMIFGGIAEELLFRESLSTCIEKDWLLVIMSAVIYTAMNFIFTSSDISLVQILAYFLPAVLFSCIYVKNKRNILLVILIKFVYNLIPLTILLMNLFNK